MPLNKQRQNAFSPGYISESAGVTSKVKKIMYIFIRRIEARFSRRKKILNLIVNRNPKDNAAPFFCQTSCSPVAKYLHSGL